MVKKKVISIFILIILCVTTSCEKKSGEVVIISNNPYEKVEYRNIEVMRGDFTPQLTLTLQGENFEKINYGMMNEELELEQLNVKVGDKVKKGDVLVKFKSDSINEKLKEYEEQRELNRLLVEHYSNLMKLDDSVDYSEDISMLQEDIRICDLYIEEFKDKLKDYKIIAKRKGTITYISEYLQNGYYKPGKNLVSQVCGSGKYTVATTEADEFEVGKKYMAKCLELDYEMELVKSSEGVLIFKPTSDVSSLTEEDRLDITINKPTISNAVYVDSKAVWELDGNYYVYLLDEKGYRDVRQIKIGESFNGYTIITEGLSGGEKVTY